MIVISIPTVTFSEVGRPARGCRVGMKGNSPPLAAVTNNRRMSARLESTWPLKVVVRDGDWGLHKQARVPLGFRFRFHMFGFFTGAVRFLRGTRKRFTSFVFNHLKGPTNRRTYDAGNPPPIWNDACTRLWGTNLKRICRRLWLPSWSRTSAKFAGAPCAKANQGCRRMVPPIR